MAACGGHKTKGGADSVETSNQTAKQGETSADTNSNKIGTEPGGSNDSSPGAKLIAGNDCGTCHKQNEKVIGPAFVDIAAKYPPTESNIDTLANKVIKGGSGHWGTIPMTPHPALAVNDAKAMVTYILSLKK